MATYTDDEIAKLRERADRAEAELAALQGKASEAYEKESPRAASSKSSTDSAAAHSIDSSDDPDASDGEAEMRKDSMMVHLMDSLAAGKDIGHYGRLVFAMVARHFLPHEEVLGWLNRDSDFGEAKAEAMLSQVEERGYNPPKRDRILQWQKEQEFPILPDPEDPDCGSLYRTLKFPDSVYHHIEEYQEQKHELGH